MRKLLFVVVIACAVTAGGLAYAQDANDSIVLTSKAKKVGTAKKPKPIAPSWGVDIAGAVTGNRSASPLEHDWSWTGVQENGKYFPKCTVNQIDAKQSDAGCPKGSVVATGKLTASLGPDGVRDSNIPCAKSIKVYNAGNHKADLYAYGDAAQCAGVGYLPPIPITWTKKGHTSTQVFVFPPNIVHPLPGIEGAFTHIEYHFVKNTVKVKGKKIGYLESYGCGKAKTRTFTFTSKTNTYSPGVTKTVSAGKC